MALVIVTYYALYLPALIESFIQYDARVKFYVNKAVLMLFFTNALINPFIYSRQSVEFNAAYRKIVRKKEISMSNLYVIFSDLCEKIEKELRNCHGKINYETIN